MQSSTHNELTKVPELTMAFWLIKILATTLGETGGDAVSQQMRLKLPCHTRISLAADKNMEQHNLN